MAPPKADPAFISRMESPSPFDRLLVRLGGLLGLDRAVLFTILARGWSSLAGIATLILIARFLTPSEQGYYYTFYSLVALQIVFELGFSVVILQAASHEAAHLTIAPHGSIAGPDRAHSRLASVLQKSVRWYSIAAGLMAVVVLPAGIVFFHAQPDGQLSAHTVSWFIPWILVIFATCCTFQIDPIFSFLEGCGFVPQIARARLAQAMLGPAMGWIALLLHHGLLAPGLVILGQAIAGGFFIYRKRRLLLPLLRHDPREYRIHWGSEIWPFQWRIAVSWLCGYFIFQLFNPILFHYWGASEAGQMGMSISICATLSSMAIAWMNTKAAFFGQMIARREYQGLDQSFFRALLQSTIAAIVAFSLALIVIIILRDYHVVFAFRLLPPVPLSMLFGATILNIIVSAEALYLRAHKQEKFMSNSIVGALSVAPTALIFGRLYGAFGITACYFVCSLIGLGYGTFTFSKWRRIWHAS